MNPTELLPQIERRVLLGNVSWETYLTLSRESANPRGRLSYDHGVLEIMSPSFFHESIKRLIGRMIEVYTFEKNIDARSASATTVKDEDRQQGFEADEAYYLEHASALQAVQEIDFKIHPPPDLVVEVDISRSSNFKLPLFHCMGVPEVWRFDGAKLEFLLRQPEGYVASSTSRCLPQFPLQIANELLASRDQLTENELLRKFLDAISDN